MNARQVGGTGACMDSPPFISPRISSLDVQSAQHQKLIPKGSQRLQSRGHLESSTPGLRRPQVHDPPVGTINECQAGHRFSRRIGWACECRDHSIQQR